MSELSSFDINTGVRQNTGIAGSSANILSLIQAAFPEVTEQVNIETPVAVGEALPGWENMQVIT